MHVPATPSDPVGYYSALGFERADLAAAAAAPGVATVRPLRGYGRTFWIAGFDGLGRLVHAGPVR